MSDARPFPAPAAGSMRILMPADGSPFSQAAVDFVASRAPLMPQPPQVELVNIQYPVPPRAARALGREIVQSHYQADAAAILDPAAAQLSAAGASVHPFFLVGTAAHELARVVREDPADLIVMGSHGQGGVGKLLFGSVTSMVAASCTKPLLVLRGDPVARSDSLKLALALDGSPYGLAAARFIARHRSFFGDRPEVRLVHVVPDLQKVVVPGWPHREVATGIRPDQVRAMQEAAFASVFRPALDILRGAGLHPAEVRLVGTDAGEQIAAWADEAEPDLIAMGSLGWGAHRFSSFGSVAMRVATRIRTPLLLVREPG